MHRVPQEQHHNGDHDTMTPTNTSSSPSTSTTATRSSEVRDGQSLDSLKLNCVAPSETLHAARNIQGHAVRTPLVKLNYKRPDSPLEIYLKLETLQPINSFKVRGAVHKILQKKNEIEQLDTVKAKSDKDDDIVIVSASAG